MLFRSWLWLTVGAISVGLLAGCRALPRRDAGPGVSSSVEEEDPVSEALQEKAAAAHAHYAAGVIAELNGETEAALEEYRTAALQDPGNEWLILEVSRRFLQNKQPEKALEILSRAAAQPGASGTLYARLGMVYSQLGKPEQAIAADRAAIKKAPRALGGYKNLFLQYVQAKKPEEALKVLNEASHAAHAEVDFLVGLSELYANLGLQFPAQKEAAAKSALELLHRAEQTSTGNPAVQMKLADGFNMLGESGKAAQIYLEVLKKLPDIPILRQQLHAKLADIYLRSKDRTKAVDQLEAISKEDPTNPLPYFYLGSMALDEKKSEEAIEHFSKTILLSPDFEQAYFELATAQLSADKPAEALATLEKARKRFRSSFGLEMLTGMAFMRQKGYTEALQHFTAAEVIAKVSDPSRLNQAFYFQLGAAYERKGNYEEAEKYFKESLKLDPNFAEALNYLGYMWAEHGVKLSEARELLEKALKLEPKNGAYLDSMGWVLFKLGERKEALNYVLKAVELNGEPDATLYDHLGDIYAALGEREKAVEAWKKSLGVEPNEEIQKKVDAAQP